ncbi:MAG: outer membrane lipoprotein chaperone LolA [Lysobacterales bacterium]
MQEQNHPQEGRRQTTTGGFFLLLGLSVLLCSGLATAQADDDTQARGLIEQFSKGLESYQADFVQEIIDDQGRQIERSWGQMSLATPRQLRWHYLGEFEQLIVADGQKVWNHDVDLEQVTVKDQEQAVDDSPLYLLMAPEALDSLYNVSLGGALEDIQLVRLMPKEARSDFDWIELGFRNNFLAVLLIQDAFGQQTRIQFSQPTRNADLVASLFEFTPPEGVDILSAEELSFEALDTTE